MNPSTNSEPRDAPTHIEAEAIVPQIATFTGHSLTDLEAILNATISAATRSSPRCPQRRTFHKMPITRIRPVLGTLKPRTALLDERTLGFAMIR
jgi:hypothetical protein